jgi:tetratricopeptide (TPR) repeat protein
LGERTHARLLERGDLSPDEARAATDRLERAIYDESLAQEATDITPEVLSNWLGNPPREILQSKPEPPPEKVHRGNLLRELRTRLETEPGLLLHGLPKVGKSQVISELITECGKEHEYFWFTFAGEHNETERLLRQLVVWIGRQTGVWKIKDDVYAGLLQPVQVFSRIGGIPPRGVWIILDDCHRLDDHAILGHLRTLTGHTWQESRVILASEEKLPVASELGIAQVPIHGFEAKEALEFVQKLGLDVSLAFLEFAMLAVRVDGHPVMLRAAVNELPHRPSSAEMSAVTERLPSVERVKGFLDGLSNQILFDVIRSAEQRTWLSRMAVLTLSFTQSIAFKLAALGPSIAVTVADWRYLSSLVLDQTGADRYSVPPLIRQLATSETDTPSPSTILTATSRHIFATAQTTGQIDLLDFQAAMFSLLLAEAYEEAAMRLILIFPSFAMAETFEPFEFLFVVLNGTPVHAKLPDPATRWMLLNAEVGLRLRDAAGGSDPKIAPLLGRMRLIFHEDWGHAARKLYSRVMHHLTACCARLRRAADTPPRPERSRKLIGSVESALRLSLISGDEEQILEALRIYDGAHRLPVGPNSLESLRQALLRVQRKDAVSGEGLVSLYEQFVARAPDVDAAVQVLREHSAQYLHAGLTEAHFACIHAEGVALLNRLQRPQRARELILPLAARASELGLSAQCIGTAELLIADTFWAEKDYAKGSSHYERALDVKFADPSFEEYITERLCDSWINLGRYQEAADLIIQALRSRRSRLPPECVTELWARLLYDFTLCQDFRKAAISCVALSRTLEHTNSDELRARVVKVISWALAQIDPSDSAAVPGGVEIANPSALSERCPPEQVQKLREIDPFQTTAVFLTAVIFELAGELRRSEALLRKALRAVEVGDSSSQIRLFQLVTYTTRILRVQIGRRRFADAAASFKEACFLP